MEEIFTVACTDNNVKIDCSGRDSAVCSLQPFLQIVIFYTVNNAVQTDSWWTFHYKNTGVIYDCKLYLRNFCSVIGTDRIDILSRSS